MRPAWMSEQLAGEIGAYLRRVAAFIREHPDLIPKLTRHQRAHPAPLSIDGREYRRRQRGRRR